MRRALWLLGLAAAMLVSGCSDAKPSSAPDSPESAPAPTTTPEAPAGSQFDLEAFDAQAVEGQGPSGEVLRTRVIGALDRYLTEAVVRPLRSGEPAGGLDAVFGGLAVSRLTGPDRAALVDEGLPPVTDVDVETATVKVSALNGPSGTGVVVAAIRLSVTGRVGKTPVTIERTGELLLAPEGETWKVHGYDIRVTRDTAAGTTTLQAP
ncbi:MAG: hypothetical protein ABR540_05300 [Acidimicrobiales bacterium]